MFNNHSKSNESTLFFLNFLTIFVSTHLAVLIAKPSLKGIIKALLAMFRAREDPERAARSFKLVILGKWPVV